MEQSISRLPTEQNNPRTHHIDRVDTLTAMRLIHEEDRRAVEAMDEALPALAEAADRIAERLQKGGRLFYVGAGTSGRIAVLDASELPATYGVEPTLVQAIVPGGYATLPDARLGDEDDRDGARRDIERHGIGSGDAVVGIAASGRTPYTVEAVREARKRQAFTAAVVNVPCSSLGAAAEREIFINTGAEAIEGSTRMKAGTVQKLALNMLSTAVMLRLGKVYGNRMVEITAINDKMMARSIRMITELTGADDDTAKQAMAACKNHVKTALAMILLTCSADEAAAQLSAYGGSLSALLRRNG